MSLDFISNSSWFWFVSNSYGEQGYEILYLTLHHIFGKGSFDLAPLFPLSVSSVIRQVLLPEAAALLIQEDLDVSQETALKILCDSRIFGCIMYSSDQESSVIHDVLQKTSKDSMWSEGHYRAWRHAKSAMTFGEWLEDQRTNGTRNDMVVKREEISEIFLLKLLGVEVIDLTDDD